MKTCARLFLAVLLLATNVASLIADDNIPDSIRGKLKTTYDQADRLFQESSKAYRDTGTSNPNLDFEILPPSSDPEKYSVYGALNVQVWRRSFELAQIYNYRLTKALDKKPPETLPHLSIGEAIWQAKDYLASAKITLPDTVLLTTARFNGAFRSCWEIRWTRTTQGYPWDDFNPNELESGYVIFHETLGLVGIGSNIHTPPPRSLEVKITREEAMEKAAKYVPLVQRTPFYLQARKAGFAANGVKSCELKVAIPNWLLDPARAVWIRDKPADETRLCWVVQFSTVDTMADERDLQDKNGKPLKLIAPDILIYVDAATGEVVGANFS